jgi:hypothetical protein
MLGHDFKVV